MSEQETFYVIEASADGDKQSEIIFGTKEDARRKLAEKMFFGTYEEAQQDDVVRSVLESFDDEENNWAGDETWEERLEQGYLRVARIDKFEQYDALAERLREAEAALQFYAERKNWTEVYEYDREGNELIYSAIRQNEIDAFGGKIAREYFNKWKPAP